MPDYRQEINVPVESPTIFAAIPPAWQQALVERLGPASLLSSREHEFGGAGLPTVRLQPDDTGKDVLPLDGITTAVIGALTAPRADSLDAALTALEAAVDLNNIQPIQELAAITRGMLTQQRGRIMVVTYDPRALTAPQDAPARGSARGIFAYCESLRPALKLRGIHLSLLLLAPRTPSPWDLSLSTAAVVHAIVEDLEKATLQRTLKLSV